jgi:anti-anti-sigma factor
VQQEAGMLNDIIIETNIQEDTATLDIEGDITGITGKTLQEACTKNPVSEAKKIILHFSKECYINSDGIAYLIDIVSESRSKSQKVSAAGLSEHYKKIFHLVGLSNIIEL